MSVPEVYQIDNDLNKLVDNMKPTTGTLGQVGIQQGPQKSLGHPNEITFLVSDNSTPSNKYAFKLELRGNFIKVSKFTVKKLGGFMKFGKDSCTSESYHPILDNLRVEQYPTLYDKISSILPKQQAQQQQQPAKYYFKIINGVIGIDTNQNTTITNLLSVPFCMANIDNLLAQPGILDGGSKQSKKTLTKEKVTYNSRKHSVYLGSRGGKYIKTKGVFVSLTRLNL